MKLRELNAKFVRITLNADRTDITCQTEVDNIADADGVWFQCPQCRNTDGHYVLCLFRNRGIPDNVEPGPGRWTPTGTGLDDLTFVPGDPPMAKSVFLNKTCGWHGFVQGGDAT